MANAKKCDRCGVLYEKDKSETHLTIIKRVYQLSQLYTYKDDNFDLCEKCKQELEQWFKRGEE